MTALANVVPGAQTTLEDTALLFNTANGNPISVSDLDTATVTVTLSVTNGALTLAVTTGLTGLAGNGTGLVNFAGSITDINAALNGLSFLPTSIFNGSDTLTLTTANGVAVPALSTVALTITSVNDAPTGEDQTIATPGNTAYAFTVEDFGFSDLNDSPAGNFQAVTITSLPGAGTLTLNGVAVNEGDSIPIPPAGGIWTPPTTPILSRVRVGLMSLRRRTGRSRLRRRMAASCTPRRMRGRPGRRARTTIFGSQSPRRRMGRSWSRRWRAVFCTPRLTLA